MKISFWIHAGRQAAAKAIDAVFIVDSTRSRKAKDKYKVIAVYRGNQAARLFDYAAKLADKLQREPRP